MDHYPIVISGKQIGQDDLLQFLADTEKLTGAKIEVTPQWIVTCESPMVENALFMLFGAPVVEVEEVGEVKLTTRGKKAVKTDPKPKAVKETPVEQEIKAWEVHIPGVTGKTPDLPERITITEKNLRLAAGTFQTGTLLRHPKAGWQKVTGEGPGQGLEPIEAVAAIALLDA